MIFVGDITSFNLAKNISRAAVSANGLLTCTAILLLHTQHCTAQAEQAVENARAHNNVKTVTVYQRNYKGGAPKRQEFKSSYAEYGTIGKKVVEKTFDETPSIIKEYKATYNDNSKPLKETWVTEFADSVTYKYDAAKGNLAEERWYWGEDKTRNKIIHEYNDAGQMVCTVSQYNYGKLTDSMFYTNGHLSLTKTYDEYGHLSTNLTYIYDNQGKVLEELKTNDEGEMVQKVSRIYYETGLLKYMQTSYYSTSEGKNKGKDVVYGTQTEAYKYDKGLPREVSNSSTNNNEKVTDTQSIYTFDDKGLLTEMVAINLLSKEKSVFRYVYTY